MTGYNISKEEEKLIDQIIESGNAFSFAFFLDLRLFDIDDEERPAPRKIDHLKWLLDNKGYTYTIGVLNRDIATAHLNLQRRTKDLDEFLEYTKEHKENLVKP